MFSGFLQISYRWIREAATYELLNKNISQTSALHPTLIWTPCLFILKLPVGTHYYLELSTLSVNPLSINGTFIYTEQSEFRAKT